MEGKSLGAKILAARAKNSLRREKKNGWRREQKKLAVRAKLLAVRIKILEKIWKKISI